MRCSPFHLLARLYPKAWRERYADEVNDLSVELLAAHEVTRPRLALELIRSAFTERIRSLGRARFAVALSASAAIVVFVVVGLLATNGFGLDATTGSMGTPSGWDSLVYGDAQLSFPSAFLTITRGPGDVTQVMMSSLSASGEACLGPFGGTVVCLGRVRQLPPAYSGEEPTIVNSVPVYLAPKGEYYAPSLGVKLVGSGPLARKIVDTLMRSRMPGCLRVPARGLCLSISMSRG